VLWGGGGHGKVVADLVRAAGHLVVGACDADAGKMGKVVEPGGTVVRWDERAFTAQLADKGTLPDGIDAVALGVGDNRARQRIAESIPTPLLPALVHPMAAVSPSVELAAGALVFAGAVVNAAARLSVAAIVNTAAVVEHDCRVGVGGHVSPGAVLAGGVSIGARAWVGAGAVVLPGLTVGDDAVVGAGAVVTKAVGRGITVAGNPARPLKGI
jgi:UDP-perosamine 4-acetyltransferase